MGGHFSVTIGGAQYQAKCIVDELKKVENYEIYYLARAVDSQFYPQGYQIVKIAEHKGLRRYAFFFDARRLLRLLKDIRPDVIYQRGLKSYTGIAAYYANRHSCKMIFHTAHDRNVQPKVTNWLTLQLPFQIIENSIAEYGLKMVEHIVVQTKQQADMLHSNYQREVSAIIPNFHPLPHETIDKSGPIKVVWVANFKPMKRPEIFVKLAKDLQYIDKVEFIMVGRTGESKLYENLHKEILQLKNLNYLGEIPIEDVNELLALAHIFVNTSVAEGFPNTFIQAWMRKVPVVSMTFNADNVLDKNDIGFFGGTYEGLKAAVKKLIEDKKLQCEMGERAQSYAFEHYSPRNVKKLISLIES